ncbi:MAG TPA: 30S ribosomal protein S6 [Candidatus Dormibacteraeota bacterium]|jgi:small subunit ribosomal protein S6|nr:30S ribosomal protein S6 [Candidatus Dormibacteraeota bacterium]
MVRDYELMYIVRPELDDEGLQAAVESVEQLIVGVGGSVVRSTSWGRRRLAYEVDHLRDGHYMLLHLRVDGSRIAEIERALTIHETVFRHLLVLHEAGADVDAVDPDTVPTTASAPVADADDEADDDIDNADDSDDEPERQTAVASDTDDETGDDGDEVGHQPAAVLATTTEEET